ncbi:MAG: DUF1572 family protein [Caldilineaceae bacterium]|nr:DUF1572 family protein [Caldilineaceae bacterium]
MTANVNPYLTSALDQFRKYKTMAERAVAQIDDDAFYATLDAEANSIAVLMKHMAGNMRSRWRDFLTSDGEKADRLRDNEFILTDDDSRTAIMAAWEAGWGLLFAALEPLSDSDMTREVTIRHETLTVLEAVNRQLTHYAYHVGQIVLLAKHAQGPGWRTLSIPRGGSDAYNQQMAVDRDV